MAYSFEMGGAARFADLCLALIAPDHEEVQLLELGRPDSGRYGFERFPDVADKVVLQVAFEPALESDPTASVLALLDAERPKILELERRGALRYIFATNLPRPEADPETGVDTVQAWLAVNCPVPATCLWREDVDRRLDWAPAATSLRFPEILDRRNAVAGVLATMFAGSGEQSLEALLELVVVAYRRNLGLTRDVFVDIPLRDDPDTTAADLLLSEASSPQAPWRLLEGESGSGKSTVARYVGNVHAARLLDDTAYLASIPPAHARTSFRIPLAIDARDYAAHLDALQAADPKRGPDRSLEAFVAGILDAALPHAPSISAVRTLFRTAPWFVMLDGLDELGDAELGARVSTSVLRALAALGKSGADIQCLVVTRPSVPGSIPSRERSLLSPIELGPLAGAGIAELTERWLASRGLTPQRAAPVTETFALLLESPSYRDLAGNPMHLRTLLELALVDGAAVPDRRSQLFQAHARGSIDGDELALTELRVRRHLVREFAGFVAWTLHRDAQTPASAFGATIDGLTAIATDFVDAHNHPAHVVGALVAALQRLPYVEQSAEGLVRFRDQAVREFLCAQYLLESEPADARSARLARLVGRPHWANVARFFAGLYSDGDLDALVDDIIALIADEAPAVSLHARELGHAILTDRVMRSRPRTQGRLVHAVFGGAGVELAARRPYGRAPFALAPDCGREELRDLLMADYVRDPSGHMRESVAQLLEANGGPDLVAEFTAHAEVATGQSRTERLSAMFRCGAHRHVTADRLESLIYDDQPQPKELYLRLTALIDAGTTAFSVSPRMSADLIEQLLKWGATRSAGNPSRIASFATVVADGKNTVAVIEGLAFARDYDSAAIAIEAIRTEFGDTWATFALAAAAAGIPRHSNVGAVEKSLMDPALPLCDRALAARFWRGRSAWWAEELAGATSTPERMFWAVVLAAWGSASHVTDHLEALDAALAALDGDEYLLVVSATQTALRGREVHGGRPRPAVPIDRVSDRAAILVAIAFSSDELRPVDPDRAGALIARVAERTVVAERMRAFQSWAGLSEQDGLEWADVFAEAARLDSELPDGVAARVSSDPMPPAAVARVLRSPERYPGVLVTHGILSAEAADRAVDTVVGEPV
ncbi:MAG: hypothetical protein JWP85_1617 [Rhodoglobus sp.]|nr:hypothetical protein [Rhodoglobus sp.]